MNQTELLNILNRIDSISEDMPVDYLEEMNQILKDQDLTNENLSAIINMNCKLAVGKFLINYPNFSQSHFEHLEQLVIDNLDHKDRMFVSDLIEAAEDWNFDLPYAKCLEMLNDDTDGDNWMVQIALVSYVWIHLDMTYIKEVIATFNKITNDPEQEQSVQACAAFYLFRITMKREPFDFLVDLVVNCGHCKLLSNLLSYDYNSQECFEYHDFLQLLCKNE